MKRVALHDAAAGTDAARADRPATVMLHDGDDARVVLFRIAAGQQVPPHQNPSTVLLQVVSGAGVFGGAGGEQAVAAGDLVVYAPDELHGMRAEPGAEAPLVVLATIAPRPASRPAAAPAAPVA